MLKHLFSETIRSIKLVLFMYVYDIIRYINCIFVQIRTGCCGNFLAHLSRRLIGELIVYQWSGVRRRRPQYSNIFFSETDWPIKAKFYVEPPWEGGTIFCSRHLGHMTKMAATPIYGKNPSKIFFSRTGGPIFMKLGM